MILCGLRFWNIVHVQTVVYLLRQEAEIGLDLMVVLLQPKVRGIDDNKAEIS